MKYKLVVALFLCLSVAFIAGAVGTALKIADHYALPPSGDKE